jgi:cytochrome P450
MTRATWPNLGEAWRFALSRNFVETVISMANRRGGIARLPMPGSRNFWVVTGHDYLARILKEDASSFDKGGPIFDVIGTALGNEGLFTVNDPDLHRRFRRLMQPVMERNQASIGGNVEGMWWKQLSSWDTSQPIRLFDEFKLLNIRLITGYLFGQSLGDQEVEKIVDRARPVFEGMASRVFLPRWMPGAKGYKRAIQQLDEKVYAIIESRRTDSRQDDMLGKLMAADPPLSGKQLRDQVFTIFMAGFDSTATAQAWAAVELAENPAVQTALRDEALQSKGTKDLDKLREFVRKVTQKYPSFPLFFRNAVGMTVLGDHTIREGDQMILAPRSAGLPFGMGRRSCPGENMAITTAVTTLSMLLRRFKHWERPSHNSGKRIRYAMTAPPRDGALVKFS